jgi:hypothetical protein
MRRYAALLAILATAALGWAATGWGAGAGQKTLVETSPLARFLLTGQTVLYTVVNPCATTLSVTWTVRDSSGGVDDTEPATVAPGHTDREMWSPVGSYYFFELQTPAVAGCVPRPMAEVLDTNNNVLAVYDNWAQAIVKT